MTPAPVHYRRALFPIASHLHGPLWVPATLPALCTPRAPVSQFQAIWARVSTTFPTKLAGTSLPRPSRPFLLLPLLYRNNCRGGGPTVTGRCVRTCHLRYLCPWAAPCPSGCFWSPGMSSVWRDPTSSNSPACFLCPPLSILPDLVRSDLICWWVWKENGVCVAQPLSLSPWERGCLWE